jgi:hypothetical protein
MTVSKTDKSLIFGTGCTKENLLSHALNISLSQTKIWKACESNANNKVSMNQIKKNKKKVKLSP